MSLASPAHEIEGNCYLAGYACLSEGKNTAYNCDLLQQRRAVVKYAVKNS